jgi:hypothetical protein
LLLLLKQGCLTAEGNHLYDVSIPALKEVFEDLKENLKWKFLKVRATGSVPGDVHCNARTHTARQWSMIGIGMCPSHGTDGRG